MTDLLAIYKCEICGNIVEVVHTGQGQLVCCGQPMVKQVEKNSEQGLVEKHLPLAVRQGEELKIKIGSLPHPMEENHYIEWVEVIAGEKIFRQKLNPGDKPEVSCQLDKYDYVRAYCNLHGLWRN